MKALIKKPVTFLQAVKEKLKFQENLDKIDEKIKQLQDIKICSEKNLKKSN